MTEKDAFDMKTRIADIQRRIVRAAERGGRNPADIRLVAVSKTVPVEKIEQARAAGLTLFGENYVQEARRKIEHFPSEGISWHFIGHLQTNKAKYAVRCFDLIHSIDSLRLAQALDGEASKIGKVQAILIQVNIAREASKSGTRLQDAQRLVTDIAGLKHIAVQGLMTMPPYFDDPEKARPFFSALRELRNRIVAETPLPGLSLPELSMGMSGDFEAAIECGATLVRIGTAIFGDRP